ncbi:response regulator [Flavobacterium petrolei]|jgi:CRP-like cAMP-binding protein/ActR/RegA family two-component response regulator|uniref:Response regulator n=1 Tax=Flavobacterium petrolei TaxID=2259594 RepID=A0A482TVF1_9FLAO|nr:MULTISPECIES: response regulator [Flavobacterium]MDD2819781.1 response regulator [Flavobacterium sp.]QIH37362.1 response regulator [Flavobacterium sp. Sr18]RYJ51892.1 response regulator [Flavobacterium petrolei]
MSKILVIEDNKEIRDNIVEILELANYEVTVGKNGKQGLEIAMTDIPDIILCDIMMPDLDGYDVLYLINKNAETSNIPFIFITSKSERLDLRKGMEMGADDYLTKPFGRLELLNAIEIRLKKKDLQHDFYSRSLEQLDNLIPKNEGLIELKKIIAERKSRLFKKNQVVYYEGDSATGIYLVLSGKIKTIKMTEEGRELMTGIYQTEDFFGNNVILCNKPYDDTATALEDSSLFFFPKSQFDELLRLYPDVSGKFLEILSNEIRNKDAYLLQLAYQSVRKRIAEAILRMFKKSNSAIDSVSISRDDLAALSGTAIETVSRTLTEFKNEGLIEKKGRLLKILNHDKISKMIN